MRIAQIAGMKPTKYGGFERLMLAKAAIAAQRGHEMHFVWEGPPIPSVAKELAQYGARSITSPARGHRLGFVRWMASYLKQNSIDVVHSHFEPASMLTLLAARMVGTPLAVCTIHTGLGLYAGTVPRRVAFNARVRNMMAMRVFAVADSIRREFLDVGCRKIRLHYLGVPCTTVSRTQEDIRRELSLSPDSMVLGCVAVHRAVKGLDVLLRSLVGIVQDHPAVKLLLIGTGDPNETAKLQKLAADLSISDHVLWAGLRNDVPDLMSIVDVYVQPSRSEGLPLSICEAMTAGLPVAASNVDGIAEAVVDGVTGLLVSVESTEELGCAIDKLVSDAALRSELGNNGRKRARERFDLDCQTLRMIKKYEKMHRWVTRGK